MKEQGTVIDVCNNTVKIKLTTTGQCAKCGLCSQSPDKSRILSIKTQKLLKINDRVTLEINQQLLTVSFLLLYGVPIVTFVTGAILGYYLGNEILATLMGIAFAAIGFFLVKFISKKMFLTERIAKITDNNF